MEEVLTGFGYGSSQKSKYNEKCERQFGVVVKIMTRKLEAICSSPALAVKVRWVNLG